METNSPNRQKALVTGGGGFLGGAVVRMLKDRGDTVRSFSRGTYPMLAAMGVEQVRGDIGDTDAVAAACDGVDVVYHVAAKPGVWGRYDDYYRANTLGTLNVLSACRHRNVPRLVYTSSPSVVFDGNDQEGVDESVPYPPVFHTHYQETKAAAEQAVTAAAKDGLLAIVLRPHLIWGPEDNHLVPRIVARARQLRIVGTGENLVDTIYVDNAAHAHLLAGDRLADNPSLSGRCYFISQGEPVRLWRMVNDILAAAGKPPVNRSISHSAARRIGGVLEGVYRLFRLPGEPRMTRFVADELATSHWFDISAARRDLGYEPIVSMEEGLERLAVWLKGENPGAA